MAGTMGSCQLVMVMCQECLPSAEGQLPVGDFHNRLVMCHSDVFRPFMQTSCLETCRPLSLFLGLWTPLLPFIIATPSVYFIPSGLLDQTPSLLLFFFLIFFFFFWMFALILELFLSFDRLSNLFGILKCPFSPSSTKFLDQIIFLKNPHWQWCCTQVS